MQKKGMINMAPRYYATRFPIYANDLMKHDAEYTEQAWEIMDEYMLKYKKEIGIMMEPLHQAMLRAWLKHKDEIEQAGGYVSPEIHDLNIRHSLDIGEHNPQESTTWALSRNSPKYLLIYWKTISPLIKNSLPQ